MWERRRASPPCLVMRQFDPGHALVRATCSLLCHCAFVRPRQALERAKLEEAGGKAEDKKGRPTGKAWFLQQEAAHIEVRMSNRCPHTRPSPQLLPATWLCWLYRAGKGPAVGADHPH